MQDRSKQPGVHQVSKTASRWFSRSHLFPVERLSHLCQPDSPVTQPLPCLRTSRLPRPSFHFHRIHPRPHPPVRSNGGRTGRWPFAAPWCGRSGRCRSGRSSSRSHPRRTARGGRTERDSISSVLSPLFTPVSDEIANERVRAGGVVRRVGWRQEAEEMLPPLLVVLEFHTQTSDGTQVPGRGSFHLEYCLPGMRLIALRHSLTLFRSFSHHMIRRQIRSISLLNSGLFSRIRTGYDGFQHLQ